MNERSFKLPKFINLVGQKYGELLVVEMLHNYNNTKRMYCRCLGDDGNEYIIRQDALRSGATLHIKGACKAGKAQNISGYNFGRLTAIEPTKMRTSNSNIIWKCKCSCGNYTYVPISTLKRGHTTSCGCKKRSKMEQQIVDWLNEMHANYVTEKSFPDCFNDDNSQHLYFDFYFPEQNTVIEYDSIIHYEPIEFIGGIKRLEHIQLLDRLKDEYCKNKGIRMIRIPYFVSNEEIIEILYDITRPATTTVI